MLVMASGPGARCGKRWRRGALGAAVMVVVAALFAASAASAATGARGAQVLEQVQAGDLRCRSLSTAELERIGEYVMGRMLGSPSAHAVTDRQMTAAMGVAGERQAHVFMRQRFSGCATGRAPSSFGTMMGMVGAGMSRAAAAGPRTTGHDGGMMHRVSSPSDGDGWSSAQTVTIVLLGLLIVLVAGALLAWRPWRRGDVPPPRHAE